MGSSYDISVQFDLGNFLNGVDDLDALVAPCDRDEMDTTINVMYVKALGPDFFNGMFSKKCCVL